MKESTKKLLSFALASTLVAGVPVAAHADNTVSIKGVVEEAGDIVFYTVKDGDTLGKIAERYYGNAAYWEQLAAYNNMQYPSKLAIGQAVLLPRYLPMLEYAPCVPTQDNQEATVVVDNYAEDSTYTVKKGDTLYCIVRVQYGLTNQEAVDKLATYNGLSDPNRLSVGQVLYIPCIEKLQAVVQNDYTDEYNRMGWILNHPDGCKPCEPKPCNPRPCEPRPCEPRPCEPKPCYDPYVDPCYLYGPWGYLPPVEPEHGFCPVLKK